MATYRLTTGDDSRNGSNSADTFDGYEDDDGLGRTGGNDTLDGRGGDDLFLIDVDGVPVGGLIDGGSDTDTVVSYGLDLGQLSFQNVEILSVESFEFGASIDQLNAFSTITSASLSRVGVYLTGNGGTIDVSSRMAPGKAVSLNAQGLGSGYIATGTSLDDAFINSRFDDIVHGGAGSDTLFAANRTFAGSSPEPGGTDTVFGDGGGDSFYLCSQSGTFDGGAGVDTVYAFQFNESFVSPLGNLADASFVNMERLVTGARITYATAEQLAAFTTITGGDANKQIWFDQRDGAGGTIDFSTKLKLPGEHVVFRAFGATSAVNVTGTAGNDTLQGSDFGDQLTGGEGDDYLAGANFNNPASGKDTLRGGAGDDTYYIDGVDVAVETLTGAAGGTDTVVCTVSCDLANTRRLHGEFENLTLNGYLGAENPNTHGYGNALDNVITGNGGNNYLDGRAGADRMVGKAGNDTFVVDDAGDTIAERDGRNDGTERVLSSVSFDLGDAARVTGFIENLTLQGTAALDGTGNDLDNRLTGNAGANVLDGGGGRDIMTGLAGRDTYYVDAAGDRVIEADGGGTDTVYASVTFSLSGQFAERLWLTGSAAINGIGNQLDNTVVGNAANNILNGGAGSDRLIGGGGADSFAFNAPLGPTNIDTISDFNVPLDTIRLDDAVFSALSGSGRLAAAEFAWTEDGEAADGDDRIVYEAGTGHLYYDADGSGAADKVHFATLKPNLAALTNADFVVV